MLSPRHTETKYCHVDFFVPWSHRNDEQLVEWCKYLQEQLSKGGFGSDVWVFRRGKTSALEVARWPVWWTSANQVRRWKAKFGSMQCRKIIFHTCLLPLPAMCSLVHVFVRELPAPSLSQCLLWMLVLRHFKRTSMIFVWKDQVQCTRHNPLWQINGKFQLVPSKTGLMVSNHVLFARNRYKIHFISNKNYGGFWMLLTTEQCDPSSGSEIAGQEIHGHWVNTRTTQDI